MTDVLMCFAQPLFDELAQDAPLETYRYALQVAQLAWNADLLPDTERAIEEMAACSPDPAGLRRGIASLRERKRRLFPEDPRLIVEFRVEPGKDGFCLETMSTTSHVQGSANGPDAPIIAAPLRPPPDDEL